MSTITISRQLGSLGLEIASVVAERLGFRLIRREVINQAARRAGAPEAALAAIDELGLLKMNPSPQQSNAYHAAVKQVMEELAGEGRAVIVGRAGQAVLRDHPGVMHVRIIAPMSVRIERVAERHGISKAAASAQIAASDRYRRNYLKRFYQLRWQDPEAYHLIINTGNLTAHAAVEIIVAAANNYFTGGQPVSSEEHGTAITAPR